MLQQAQHDVYRLSIARLCFSSYSGFHAGTNGAEKRISAIFLLMGGGTFLCCPQLPD
jgi:hypothetical protein